MKRAGRKRRVVGWSLIALGVTVAAVWAASRWWSFGYGYNGATWGVGCAQGVAVCSFDGEPGGVFWGWAHKQEQRTWLWSAREAGDDFAVVTLDRWFVVRQQSRTKSMAVRWYVAFWPVPLILWGAGGAFLLIDLLRARRRVSAGCCAGCGYSLIGLAKGVACPECGKGAERAGNAV